MRNDMMKVVVEPARNGSAFRIAKGEKVRLQREGIDSVQQEGLGRRWEHDDRSAMRDHLTALRRFLQKQVGRPWDEVYSEICSNAPKGSFLGHHLRELVSYEVSSDVRVAADGVMYGARGWKVYDGDLYACPETGILKLKGEGVQRKRNRYRQRGEHEYIAVDDNHRFVKVDGLWFFVTLSAIPDEAVTARPSDVVLKVPVFTLGPKMHASEHRVMRCWGGNFYASAKRQANSREVARIIGALAEGKSRLSLVERPVRSSDSRRCFRRR
ncbi:MAG: hypothetical protein KGS72_18365 [Cyanobacteria bacterium REEB67]|nr:hypothetical protein [Cyanobacteria bacterium REEB67]